MTVQSCWLNQDDVMMMMKIHILTIIINNLLEEYILYLNNRFFFFVFRNEGIREKESLKLYMNKLHGYAWKNFSICWCKILIIVFFIYPII